MNEKSFLEGIAAFPNARHMAIEIVATEQVGNAELVHFNHDKSRGIAVVQPNGDVLVPTAWLTRNWFGFSADNLADITWMDSKCVQAVIVDGIPYSVNALLLRAF